MQYPKNKADGHNEGTLCFRKQDSGTDKGNSYLHLP